MLVTGVGRRVEPMQAFKQAALALVVMLEARGLCNRRAECLAAYREHVPEANLYDSALDLVHNLRSRGVEVGVIADGRPAAHIPSFIMGAVCNG